MIDIEKNLTNWIFGLERSKKRLIQLLFDGLVVSTSLLLAFFMRLETTNFLYRIDTYVGLLIAITTALGVFAARGQYNNVTRHISTEAVYTIAIGSSISSLILLSSVFLLELVIPRSIPLIYGMLLCLFATAIRFFVRALGQRIIEGKPTNVAIYGTGVESIQLMEALQKNVNYRVRILIDDSSKINNATIGGVAIANLAEVAPKIKQLKIKILLIAEPSDISVIRDRILDVLSDHPLKIKTIPSISKLISGETNISEMADIKIEDLLGRKPADYNPELMAESIVGKTILVTGAGGSIGSELCRQIIPWKPKKLILLDISEYSIYRLLEELNQHPNGKECELVPSIGSVQDRQFVKKIFDHFAVDTTYHAAAYKHVPLMEQNVMQCFTNNVFGTINVVEFAIAGNVENFVLISTDKAVNPTNFMGASKRFAEIVCQSLPPKETKTCFSIVRFGNVLGSSGSVVPLFKKQIESGGPITLTHHEVTRYFMTVSEASQLVIQAGSIGNNGNIYVLDMGEPVKILELAKRMAALSGLRPILSGKKILEDDEIAITITGLRPGEKLFEELAYSSNLSGTEHPQINTTEEKPMSRQALQELLHAAGDAISANDHEKLYKTIASVAKGVVDLDGSCDVFIKRHGTEDHKVTFLRGSKN